MTRDASDASDAHAGDHDAAGTAGAPDRPQIGALTILQEVLKLSNKLIAPFSTYLERQYKIGLNEFRLLMLIGRYDNLASHELADMTGVNPMSVSRAVAALAKHKRIVIVPDTGNRRRKMLALSPDGRALFDAMRPQTDSVADYLVSALEPDEIRQFSATLRKLTETLEAQDEQGRSRFMEQARLADAAARKDRTAPAGG